MILLALVGISFSSSAFANKFQVLRQAELAYEKGQCVPAIEAYRQIYYQYGLTNYEKDLILFRTSYCYLLLGQLDPALEGFAKFVKKFPEHDEARLRLAQTYFQQLNFRMARYHANLVRMGPFGNEALLLAAQCDIEMRDPERAITRLTAVDVPRDWFPLIYYWLGVAHYNLGERKRAYSYFRAAKNLSPEQLWVKAQADAWMNQITIDQRWLHGSLILGFISDRNLGQSSTLATDSAGVPVEASPKEASYLKDNGYSVAAELSARLYYTPKSSLVLTGAFSSPFYNNYSTYNYQNLSGMLYSNLQVSRAVSVGLSTKYLNTRYNYAYNQDYLIVTPHALWLISPNASLGFEVPFTWYVRSRFSKSIAPTVTARLAVEPGSLFFGASYAQTWGSQALYGDSAGTAYLISGTMFSNYETLGMFGGMTFNLPARFFLTLNLAAYTNSYAKENILASSRQSELGARKDHLRSYGIDLTRVMIPNLWSLGANYTYTTNKSSGLQGLPSSGYITDYNYTRSYIVVSSTLGF